MVNPLFSDAKDVRKNLESERRILRLQQVRAESNNIARNVRNNVEREKEKQLRKLENVKTKELIDWRRDVLAKVNQDYRDSVFQIGSAHVAALSENDRVVKNKLEPASAKSNIPEKDNVIPRSEPNKENDQRHSNFRNNRLKQKTNNRSQRGVGICPINKILTNNKTAMKQTKQKGTNYEMSSTSDSGSDIDCDGINNQTLQPSIEDSSEFLLTSTLSQTESVSDRKSENEKMLSSVKKVQAKSVSPKEEILKRRNMQFNRVIQHDPTENEKKKTDQTGNCSLLNDQPKAGNRYTQISDFIKNNPSSIAIRVSPKVFKMKSYFEETDKIARKDEVNSRNMSSQIISKRNNNNNRGNNAVPNRVQFYDYNNKFCKQYPQPDNVVKADSGECKTLQTNAVEEAFIERQLNEAHKLEIEKLKSKSDERCRKALECEQVRRDCNELTEKLDALNNQCRIIPSDEYDITDHRLAQISKLKEFKITNAVEDIFKRPAIITCPEILRHSNDAQNYTAKSSHKGNQPNLPTDDINLETAFKGDPYSINSSDSSSSILLGYVNNQSKQISDDLRKCDGDVKAIDNKEKTEKLQNLLRRIEKLRIELIKELSQSKPKMQKVDNKRVENIVNSINEMSQERVDILIDGTKPALKDQPNAKDEMKFNNEKVKKIINHTNSQTDEVETNNSNQHKIIHRKSPFEIIIKVKENSDSKRSPSKTKVPRKLSTLIQSPVRRRNLRKKNMHQKTATNIRPKSLVDTKSQPSSNESNSTSYRSLPPNLTNNVDFLVNEYSAKVTSQKYTEPSVKDELNKKNKLKTSGSTPNLNPLLAHYVQRLLVMSRNSINALGMSSSNIETPSSSIVNTTANLSAIETDALTKSRMERVENFIDDNYSFLSELEESIKHHSSASTDSSSQAAVNEIWKTHLEEKYNRSKNVSHDYNKLVKSIKPILKKVSTRKNEILNKNKKIQTHKEESTNNDNENVAAVDKGNELPFAKPDTTDAQVSRYNQLTENCSQRISELNDLINKVRQEKQKILEITLSSVSENGRNSTEYLELPMSAQDRTNNENVQAIQLEKNKPNGMSRDSGISLSRPITAQEESNFDDINTETVSSSAPASSHRNQRPPISLSRFSPQITEQDLPHQLSTILEVDTPVTSRLNTSIQGQQEPESVSLLHPDSDVNILLSQREQIPLYKKYQSYKEYAKENNLDETQVNSELSVLVSNEGKEQDIRYKEYSFLRKNDENVLDSKCEVDLMGSLRLSNVPIKKFPSRKEYFEQNLLHADSLDSQMLTEYSGTTNTPHSSQSSSESINIEDELIKRNILKKGFVRNNKILSSKATNDKSLRKDVEKDPISESSRWSDLMKQKQHGIDNTMTSSTLSSSSFMSKTKGSQIIEKNNDQNTLLESSQENSVRTTSTDEGNPINLREFLTKELLKRTNTSSSLSSTDDSLARIFVRSILGSMAPSPKASTGNNGGPSLDRHKTSTPVVLHSTVNRSSGSSSSIQLFSGESGISSVHLNQTSKDVDQTNQPQ